MINWGILFWLAMFPLNKDMTERKKICLFVLPVFDGVLMDGHPINWVVDAGVSTIEILDAHPF